MTSAPTQQALPVSALLETPDLMREWLEGMLPNDVAGTCGLPDQCVIADFLAIQGVGPYISVGKFDVLVGTSVIDSRQHLLPEWCCTFIRWIDGYGMGTFITAQRALVILGEVWT